MRRVTPAELFSIGLSLIAVAVSAWAVVESRRVALDAHRQDVRGDVVQRALLNAEVYSYAYCVLRVSGDDKRAGEVLTLFKDAKEGSSRLLGAAGGTRTADELQLDEIETDIGLALGEIQQTEHLMMQVRLDMDDRQLDRLGKACGDPPYQR